MTEPNQAIITKAKRYTLTFNRWLQSQVYRFDEIGQYARHATNCTVRYDGFVIGKAKPDNIEAVRLLARRAYHATLERRTEAMTSQMPDDVKSALRAVYLNPTDRDTYRSLNVLMWLRVGSTPVILHEMPGWANRKLWESIGMNLCSTSKHLTHRDASQNTIAIDHWGRTLIHGHDAFTSEPYIKIRAAIDMAMSVCQQADVIAFATMSSDWGAGACRIVIMPPNGIVPPEMRRKIEVPAMKGRRRGINY